jgi:cell wall assembly regulator SMI1
MYGLLTLENMVSEAKTMREMLEGGQFTYDGELLKGKPGKGIRGDWWNINWIPVASDYSGNLYCIDLAPVSSGRTGQIIEFLCEDSPRSLITLSFSDLISKFADDLEKGLYSYDSESNQLIKK